MATRDSHEFISRNVSHNNVLRLFVKGLQNVHFTYKNPQKLYSGKINSLSCHTNSFKTFFILSKTQSYILVTKYWYYQQSLLRKHFKAITYSRHNVPSRIRIDLYVDSWSLFLCFKIHHSPFFYDI